MPIDRIVVVGGGVGGWLAASMIARALPDLRIEIVDSSGVDQSLGIASMAETFLPDDLETLASFGFDEAALVQGARASFALGTAMSAWRGDEATAFIPFGDIGAPLGPTAFHQLAARLRDGGATVNFANYSLGALCAQSERFARARPDDRSVHSMLTYGLNVDTTALTQWLKADALAHRVTLTTRDNLDGADLIIDAGGPRSDLAGPGLSWSEYFPCDRMVAVMKPATAPPKLYVHLEAHDAGWQSFVPVQGAIAETFAYASPWLPAGPSGEHYECGRQHAAWRGNVVSIGGAAALIDPIAGTQLHGAVSDVARLIALFPGDRSCDAEAGEYNRQWREKTDCLFDYALLRLARCARPGAPFWADVRSRPLPDRLAYRLALYESCGRVALHDGESFEEPQWVASFDAMGVRPRRYDALAQGIDIDQIQTHFGRIRDVMLQAVAAMPPYPVYLDHISR